MMPEDPSATPSFICPDPEVEMRITAAAARIAARTLEADAEGNIMDFDSMIVETLVENFDLYARAYLEKVSVQRDVPAYQKWLGLVGTKLLVNAERNSHLRDPYSERELRACAESSRELIRQRHRISPEQYEEELQEKIEQVRSETQARAIAWHTWRNQIVARILSRFGARSLIWLAKALDKAKGEVHVVEDEAARRTFGSTASARRGGSVGADERRKATNDGRERPFPERASWLAERLHERGWDTHELSRQRGPDHKTTQKILDGQDVREDVLEKVANALSKAPAWRKLPLVTLLDIPRTWSVSHLFPILSWENPTSSNGS
jgi:hypothetical protein